MADGEEADVNAAKTNPPKDDILVNGDADNAKNNNLLQPNDGTMPGQAMPRRSSLVKDQNRRGQSQAPKKTVSFSSMPNEKTVVNGKLNSRFSDTDSWFYNMSVLAISLSSKHCVVIVHPVATMKSRKVCFPLKLSFGKVPAQSRGHQLTDATGQGVVSVRGLVCMLTRS
ncbi:hypothetical protein NP493_138g03002 [Ridgeia piscesae]|uniref:Uncharacterized protein n=1 Tax=Ridgeia piscesae TaxID=27915 RepID=A0AAD9P5A4_RIDPI|nr:hypothetical protein NP493_138g03002 [Ridgeia piscesae]